MSTKYAGGCACGAIRYEVDAEPVFAFHCQCRDCRRATGCGHVSALIVPRAAARVTGTPKFAQTRTDSGHIASRGFCPDCGSHVLAGTGSAPELVAVFAGSLDDPEQFRPQMVIYHSRGPSWDHVDPALPSFPLGPPAPSQS